MDDLVGQQLGQYVLTAVIGTGGMATVYRARQTSIGRDVAIKIIQPRLAPDLQFLRRFEREVKTIASMSHPHILKVFDYGQQDEQFYLVMELINGGSLSGLIHKGALGLEQTARLLTQIASALDYAHQRGVIHRDLKPQNIMLTDQGDAILTDFGIARLISAEATALTHTGAIIGTPLYMAPEQWIGKAVDARSDVYALGITVYEMLTGEVPYRSQTPASVMYAHLEGPLPNVRSLRADLPPAIDQVLHRALAKKPEERFQSAGEFAAAFSQAVEKRGSINLPSLPAINLGNASSAKRNFLPLPLVFGAAIALIAVFSGGLFLLNNRNQQLAAASTGTAIALLPTDTATTTLGAEFPAPRFTATPLPTATNVPPTETDTSTPLPTDTETATPTDTLTFTPSSTFTPSRTATNTKTFTPTATSTATATITLTPSITPSETQDPVIVAARVMTRSAALTAIAAASATKTYTPDYAATNQIVAVTQTAVAIASFTKTPTPSDTPTITPIPPTPTPIPPTLIPAGFGGGTGKFIFVHEDDLWIANYDGTDVTPILNTPFDEAAPSWSPDGKRIAFRSNQDGAANANASAMEIYVMDADGSNIERLTNDEFEDSNPTFSPDGRYIAYRSAREKRRDKPTGLILDNDEVFLIDLQNKDAEPVNLTAHIDDDLTPKWSPTSDFIIFSSQRDGNAFQIFRMKPDGTEIVQLTDNGFHNYTPSVSYDGKRMVFSSKISRDGGAGIFIGSSNGGGIARLYADGRMNLHPTFSPDGDWLLFTSQPVKTGTGEPTYVVLLSVRDGASRIVLEGEQPAWQPLNR